MLQPLDVTKFHAKASLRRLGRGKRWLVCVHNVFIFFAILLSEGNLGKEKKKKKKTTESRTGKPTCVTHLKEG